MRQVPSTAPAAKTAPTSLIPAGALISLLLTAACAVHAATDEAPSTADPRHQVEDLVVCYARGTDALGRATGALGDQPLDSTANLTEPAFAEALTYYRRCLAPGFSFRLEVEGQPAVTVPDPNTRTPNTDAALQWANYVNNTFRGAGYSRTQHHMGTISSEVEGDRARIHSYLIATHVLDRNRGVDVVTGSYDDVTIQHDGHWQIETRTLRIGSSVTLPP
jgi:hypothetical protein